MKSENQKWITLSFLSLSALLAYIFFSLVGRLALSYDLETRVKGVDSILRVSSIGLGFIVFLFLSWSKKINQFINEVMVELLKVTWPVPKETFNSTLIVIVMILISGVILGLLDYFCIQLLRFII